MYRNIEKTNPAILKKLLVNIESGISSMINNYADCYNYEELMLLNNRLNTIKKQIEKVSNNEINISEITTVLDYENTLKSLVFRCWILEINNNNFFVHWYKKDKINTDSKITSTTFGDNQSFCNARYGIKYVVSIDGFLGACNKDAATVIEDKAPSIYTIGVTDDNKVINSYNLATPIITPAQVFDLSSNSYKSKYNEVILDNRYIKPISVIYTDESDFNMVNLISDKYNIPIEYKEKSKNK